MKAFVTSCAAFLACALPFAQPGDIGPAPGRLVDIGSRKLHLNCVGSGSPAVILEAGASSFAIDWSLVQPEVARTQRVCSYDRAGSGWSDPRPDVETPARVVADLHTLLAAAGEEPPFVMVGASAGGIYVRLFQLDHPDDVVGFVFVDPSTENRRLTMFQGKSVMTGSLTEEQLLSTLPSSGSLPISRRSPQMGTPFDRLPPELYQRRVAIDRRLIASFPESVSADIVRESAEGERATLARLLDSRARQNNPMRSLPVVVLTRGKATPVGLADSHRALSRLSDNSRHTVVPEAGHEIHLFMPSGVIQAIQDVCLAARQRSPLPARAKRTPPTASAAGG